MERDSDLNKRPDKLAMQSLFEIGYGWNFIDLNYKDDQLTTKLVGCIYKRASS
jgi:hypothetical protein